MQSKAAQCLDEEDLSKIELALRELAVPGPAAAAGVDPDDLWINYDGFTQVRHHQRHQQMSSLSLAAQHSTYSSVVDGTAQEFVATLPSRGCRNSAEWLWQQ